MTPVADCHSSVLLTTELKIILSEKGSSSCKGLLWSRLRSFRVSETVTSCSFVCLRTCRCLSSHNPPPHPQGFHVLFRTQEQKCPPYLLDMKPLLYLETPEESPALHVFPSLSGLVWNCSGRTLSPGCGHKMVEQVPVLWKWP